MNGILKLSWVNVQSALVYGFVAVALLIISKGTVFGLDLKELVDTLVLGILASLVKNLFTTESGNFAGVVKVIPPTQ